MSTVLINSNFSCNYKINRDELFEILKKKYKIHAIYDPCSYPGIQCKFYYNENKTEQTGICECFKREMSKDKEKEDFQNKETFCNKKGKGNGKNQCREMSFMIFRTGSVLIVGHCDLKILNSVYLFVRDLLINESMKICTKEKFLDKPFKKEKKTKNKRLKKIITVM